MNGTIAVLVIIFIVAGAAFLYKFRGDKYKAKSEKNEDKAERLQETLADVKKVHKARLDGDLVERVRKLWRRD